MLNKEMAVFEGDGSRESKGRSMVRSQFSTQSTSCEMRNYTKNQKAEKLTQIEQFIEKLEVFDGERVDWSSSYSCALGPRLLLTGRLAVLPSGYCALNSVPTSSPSSTSATCSSGRLSCSSPSPNSWRLAPPALL
jgi:hypothetical protein